jgi:hypothetical protein
MTKWEYCEVDFDGKWTKVFFYDEAGDYIDNPRKHPRLGIALAYLGHEGWEIISTWWRNDSQVTYMLKRPIQSEWAGEMRKAAKEKYDSKKANTAIPPGWD